MYHCRVGHSTGSITRVGPAVIPSDRFTALRNPWSLSGKHKPGASAIWVCCSEAPRQFSIKSLGIHRPPPNPPSDPWVRIPNADNRNTRGALEWHSRTKLRLLQMCLCACECTHVSSLDLFFLEIISHPVVLKVAPVVMKTRPHPRRKRE